MSTWAVPDDLYARYGDEAIDKLATRNVYDSDVDSYVADESEEGRLAVINLALEDAKNYILQKLSCLYTNLSLVDEHTFPIIKQWHIKATIQHLKTLGSCKGCDCDEDMAEYIKCGNVCSDDGTCLPGARTAISVSEAKFPCECAGACRCC